VQSTEESVLEDASATEKWALVERVTASKSFRKATRLRDFLLYVCDRALKGDLDNIREQQIGQAVFNRGLAYNPAEDNIVRVEARQVRKRLALYFETEGRREPVVIVIPKGCYVPDFRERDPDSPLPGEQDGIDSGTASASSQPPAATSLLPQVGLFVTAVAVLLAGMWLWGYNSEAAPRAATEDGTPDGSIVFPWTAVFDREQQTTIVLADSILALLQDIARTPITLDDYMNRRYIEKVQAEEENPALRQALGLIALRQYTSIADVALIQKVLGRAPGFQDRVMIKYARNMNVREFKMENFILVGSAQSNPWVELFQAKMNFHIERDPETWELVVRNKQPKLGELATYGPSRPSGPAYSVVALLPNLTQTGSVLIIEGTMMEGTEAGGEFLSDPTLLPHALAQLGLGGKEQPQYFEILLRSRLIGGTSKDIEPIAYRQID
jgi:hypothetical protein